MGFGHHDGAHAEPDPVPLDASGEPLENTALVEAMRNVALDDSAQTRALLFQLLLESTLVAAMPEAPDRARTWTAQAGDSLNLVTLDGGEQGSVLPVFTSPRTLLEWRPEGGGFVALPARALFEMAAGAHIGVLAIDPGSETRGTVTATELEALSRGRLPLGGAEVVAEPTKVLIGRPADPPPDEVLDVVRDALGHEPLVEQAWLYLMQQGEQPAQLVVAVRFHEPVDDEVASHAMRAVVEASGQRSEGARELLWVRATDEIRETMLRGAGIELVHP